MEQIYTQIRQYIDENRQPMLNLWRDLVNTESGTTQIDGVNAVCSILRREMENAGIHTRVRAIQNSGDMLIGEWNPGSAKAPLLLIGHMDTVFAREENQPFAVDGDRLTGSGVMDMKGGVLIMQAALAEVLPTMPKRMRVVAILSADEEIGSEGCSGVITKWAKQAFACLSFEPMRPGNTLVRQRKGVTAFQIACTGIRGHAGANYLKCASAIQQLCAVVNELYMLRDDEKLLSINVGVIHGGTAENVVCDEATLRAEVRSFDPAAIDAAWAKIEAICAKPGIPGTTTMLKKIAAHPPFHANEKSAKLLELAPNIRLIKDANTQDDLLSGEAGAAVMYTSQVTTACLANPDLQVVYPTEGVGFGIMAQFIPSNAPHSDAAHAFIDYILRPEVAKSCFEWMGYYCTNKAADSLIDPAYQSFLTLPEDFDGKTEMIQNVSAETEEIHAQMWTEFKAACGQ